MDVDMTLDEMAAAAKQEQKASAQALRKPAAAAAGGGGGGGGRGGKDRVVSGGGGRRDAPYSRPPPPASTGSSWTHDMYEGKGGRPAGRAADPTRNGGGNHSGGYQDGAPSVKIKIENVHYEINKEQLQRIFSQAGTIVDGPSIAYDRSGRSTGVAYITYSNLASATLAKEKLSGQKANGQPITITYSRVQLPKPVDPSRVARLDAASGTSNAGKPLLGRLGGQIAEKGSGTSTPTAPRSNPSSKPSTPRSAERAERAPRGVGGASSRGKGGARGGRGGKGGEKGAKRGPADQSALDKELESFMNTPAAPAASTETGEVAMEE